MKKILTLLVLAVLWGGTVNAENVTRRLFFKMTDNWKNNCEGTRVYAWYNTDDGAVNLLGDYGTAMSNNINQASAGSNIYYVDVTLPEEQNTINFIVRAGKNTNGWGTGDCTEMSVVGKYYEFVEKNDISSTFTEKDLTFSLYGESGDIANMTTDDNINFSVDGIEGSGQWAVVRPSWTDASSIDYNLCIRPWDGYTGNQDFTLKKNVTGIGIYGGTNSWIFTSGINYDFSININLLEMTVAPYITKSVAGNSKKLGTFSAEGAVAIPDGVTAYIGKLNTAKTGVDMVEVTGGVIPANTGVLYTSTADAGTQVKFYATNTGASFSTDGNILSGTGAAGKTLDVGDYVLATINNGQALGFYPINAAANYGAFKAYIPSGSVSAAKLAINFGDETGIANLSHEKTDNVYYDLQGRRVMNPTKGLFIVNGKKVIK